MRRLSKTVLIALFIVLYALSPSQAQDYQWPLKIKPKLSSQFGDYRSGHWHAGVDITTRGKPGYKVYAVDDGYVYRIRTSFWGYGKALYLKLNDGRYAVYGHLTRFDHDIEDYVRDIQTKNRKYYQDVFFKPHQFPVKKGDYIALSGQSGAGAPHLHFEIRDRNNLVLNPLKGFYNYYDNSPPKLDYFVIKRFKSFGLANYHDFEFLPFSERKDGFVVDDTISIYGQDVFSLAAYDPYLGYNYGIYGIEMFIDNVRVFAHRADQLDYGTGNQIDYVRDFSLKSLCDDYFGVQNDNDKHIFYRLYIQQNDDQLFYGEYSYPAGIIFADSLDHSVHKLEVVLYDINHNERRITAYLKKAQLPGPEIESISIYNDSLEIKTSELDENHYIEIQSRKNVVSSYKTIPANFDIFSGLAKAPIRRGHNQYRLRLVDNEGFFSEWYELDISSNTEKVNAYADYLELVVSDGAPIAANETPLDNYFTLPLPGGFMKSLVPLPVENGYFALDLNSEEGINSYYKFNSGGYAFSPDSTIRIRINDSHLYDPVVFQITNPSFTNDMYVFEILPEDLLLKSGALIEVDFTSTGFNPEKSSLYYYWKPKQKWVYIGNGKQGVIEGETMGGGKFAIMPDIYAPYISNINPHGSTSDRTPYISCRVEDKLSGIRKETQLEMIIDGYWVPAYYDIDTKEFGYQVQNPLKRTTHTVKVTAIDNQGNTSVKTSRFTIR